MTLVRLHRVDGTEVLANLDSVAFIEPSGTGSILVFSQDTPKEGTTLLVRESLNQIEVRGESD